MTIILLTIIAALAVVVIFDHVLILYLTRRVQWLEEHRG